MIKNKGLEEHFYNPNYFDVKSGVFKWNFLRILDRGEMFGSLGLVKFNHTRQASIICMVGKLFKMKLLTFCRKIVYLLR